MGRADGIIAVGGYASKSGIDTVDPVTAHGPSLLGHLKPNIVIPSPVITVTGNPTSCLELQTDGPLAGAPSCLVSYSFTSFYSPYAAGIGAVLLSAAKQEHLPVDGRQVRYALESTARFLPLSPANAQGTGAIDVPAAWRTLSEMPGKIYQYFTAAYVSTPNAEGRSIGRGVFELPGVPAGESLNRALCFHIPDLSAEQISLAKPQLIGNDGTFSIAQALAPAGRSTACLDLAIAPATEGLHSTLVRINDGKRMLALAQATMLSSARLLPSNRFQLVREGTASTSPSSVWFELPTAAFVPAITFDVYEGEGVLACYPNGRRHSVYTSYYAPHLLPRHYPDDAVKRGVGTFHTILDIPRSRIWACTVRSVVPELPVRFRITVSALGPASLILTEAELSMKVSGSAPSESWVEVEPIAARLQVSSSASDGVFSKEFSVPPACKSLRVEPPADSKGTAWTLFRCPDGRCRAWYSSALDRASSGGYTIHYPEAGKWKLVVATKATSAPFEVLVTTEPRLRRSLQVNFGGYLQLPVGDVHPLCGTSGCLVRLFDRAVNQSEQSAPLAEFSLSGDRSHVRPYDFGVFVIPPKNSRSAMRN